MAEEGTNASALGPIDEDKLAEYIQNQVAAATAAEIAKIPREREIAKQDTSTDTGINPLDTWIKPYVEPVVRQSQLATAASQDNSTFYRSKAWKNATKLVDDGEMSSDDVEAKVTEIEEEIEKTFREIISKGGFVQREIILQNVLGKQVIADPDKTISRYGKKHVKIEQQRLAKAQANADVAGSSFSGMTDNDVLNMPDDKFDEYAARMGL